MAFITLWTCDKCGYQIGAESCPDETECECYSNPDTDKVPTMSNSERKERYRIQYALNGYIWNGKPPTMFTGELPI